MLLLVYWLLCMSVSEAAAAAGVCWLCGNVWTCGKQPSEYGMYCMVTDWYHAAAVSTTVARSGIIL